MSALPLAFHLRCTATCPVAQRAMIALAERGRSCSVDIVAEMPSKGQDRASGLSVLTVRHPGRTEVSLTETIAMIELIEDLHPDHRMYPADPFERAVHREMIETGRQIQYHLSSATRAREANDLDMLVHRMRAPLLRAEGRVQAGFPVAVPRLSNVDAVFAPTLWRLRALDAAYRTFFLSGCPGLTAWADRVLALPVVRSVLPETLVPVYLEGLVRRGALLADAQQSSAWSELATRTSRVAGMG